MLHRLIENWIKRMPLPRGMGRTAVLVGTTLMLAASICFGIPKIDIAPLSEVFHTQDAGELRYTAYRQMFDSDHEAIVLIDAGPQGEHEEAATGAAYALGESLEEERKIAAVHWGLNPTTVSPKLLRALPAEEFDSQTTKLEQLKPLLQSETLTALLQAGMAEAMRGAIPKPAANEQQNADQDGVSLAEGAAVFVGLMEVLTRRMETPAEQVVEVWSELQEAADVPRWELLKTASGRLLVMRVELRDGVDGRPGYAGSLAALRRQVETIRLRFEDVELGVTGYEPVRTEAEAVMRTASMRAAGGAVLGLMLLTGLAWRSWWLPVVVVVLPAAAVAGTLGLVGGLLGTVNVLAMVGVAAGGVMAMFGGLWLAAVWARGEDRRAAVGTVGRTLAAAGSAVGVVGVGLMGVGDAALGWWSHHPAAPDIAGLRAAGGIAALGAGVAWVTVILLGAALLSDSRPESGTKRESRGELARVVAEAAGRRPRAAWLAAGVMMLAIVVMALRTPNTVDTSGFLPAEIEGAEWQRRALVQGGEWAMPLSVLAYGMEDAVAVAARLRGLPEVGQVTGIGRLIPADMNAKRKRLNALQESLGDAAAMASQLDRAEATALRPDEGLINQIRLIRTGLDFLPESVKQSLGDVDSRMKNAADTFLKAAQTLDAETRSKRLAAFQQDYTAARRQAGLLVSGLLDPALLTPQDLFAVGGLFDTWFYETTDPATGEQQTIYRLKAYPAAGSQGWPDINELQTFHNAVTAVAPEATGTLERLLVRSDSLAAAMRTLVGATALAIGLVLLACGAGGRAAAGVTLSMGASAFVMVAATGWLSQPMTAATWSLWPVVGTAVLLWGVSRSLGGRGGPVSHAAAGEAFGLMLAAGFLAAAGLRSAGAPGLTATAVAACLAVGLTGLWVLLLATQRRGAGQA